MLSFQVLGALCCVSAMFSTWYFERDTLFRLPVQRVLAATRAEFIQFQTALVIAAVLFRRIVAFLAISASHRNNRANIFLGCHTDLLRTTI